MRIHISFARPYMLLVFLFGVALTALLYFTLSKRYRKTRNRITSIVLHLIVYALAVLTLAGTLFSYSIPNKKNQIILLVDLSDTQADSADAREKFIENVLAMGQYDEYRIGVVTFGFDQVYAVPLTNDLSSILPTYSEAPTPDTSATDIAAALTYTANLFDNPETAKIVLVTDGMETDENAMSVIRSIAAKGIKLDVANIPAVDVTDDICFTDVTLPDYHISLRDEFNVSVSLYSTGAYEANVELYDNGKLIDTQTTAVAFGAQNVTFRHSFEEYGLHEISFRLRCNNDTVEQNNIYYSYIYLEQFNRVLILEQKDNESNYLNLLLADSEIEYQVTTMNIRTNENVPSTIDELCEFDQVILNNIANADMPEGFAELLYTYVNDYGGGVFTVGGSDDDGTAHAYDRDDMRNTLYQELLPVQAINYTPPVAVMVIVDRSGSMTSSDPETGANKYDLALTGAHSCLNALTERDYFGLMTLDTEYEMILPLTPRTQEAKIVSRINYALSLGATGGTVFPAAIQRACQALREVGVAKRHVIIVTDGQVPENQREEYEGYIQYYHDNDGITFSVVGIGIEGNSTAASVMRHACEIGGGRFRPITDLKTTATQMREDLNAPEIKDVNMEEFYPTINNPLSALLNGINLSTSGESGAISTKMNVSLDGFYGVKVKPTADLVLVGNYRVPIYAQWRVGKGSVGSFMCDLNGTWSADFLTDDSGITFIRNVIASLMPMENIRGSEITVNIQKDNYINKASVYSTLNAETGEKIVAQITNLTRMSDPLSLNELTIPPEGMLLSDLGVYVTLPLDSTNNYTRCNFVMKESGIYKIEFSKVNEEGTVLATYETYCAFSYSKEYAPVQEETVTARNALLKALPEHAGGALIDNRDEPFEVFANFVTEIVYTFDPRYLFMILAIILFLADIAVRKFKFKWIHEIVRDSRAKKSEKEKK